MSACARAGFMAIPAFNMDETPEDMADFIEYVNGSPESEWGRRRAAFGRLVLLREPAPGRPRPPALAAFAKATASQCNPSDTLAALNDQIEPRDSADESIPRFTWWDHCGTREWVQYDFAKPARTAVEVYFWDETRIQRHCRVPASWRLLHKAGEEWKPVENPSPYTNEPNAFNRVTFAPIETPALRIEAQLKPEWSGGILEWRVEEAKP